MENKLKEIRISIYIIVIIEIVISLLLISKRIDNIEKEQEKINQKIKYLETNYKLFKQDIDQLNEYGVY